MNRAHQRPWVAAQTAWRGVVVCAVCAFGACRDWTKPVIPPDPELAAITSEREPTTPAELLKQADAALARGDAANALHLLQRALALKPADADTEERIAAAYQALGDRANAAEFASLAIRHDPAPARVEACAAVLVKAGAPQRAADALAAVLPRAASKAQHASLLVVLVQAQGAAGDHEAAIRSARQLCELDPGGASSAVLGQALLGAGQLSEAEAACRAGIRLDARSTACWNGIGTAALNQWIASGRTDRAARDRAASAFEASLAIDRAQPKVVRLMVAHGL